MRSPLFLSFFLVAFLSMPLAAAQTSSETSKQMWTAQWITSPHGPQRDVSVLHFRKVVEILQVPEHFRVHVSADNQFVLYVNQQRVGIGPAHSDLNHWKYETYDLAPFLHGGRNVLAATVWNFGVLTPLLQISDRIGFVLHGESEAGRVADTGPSWEVEEEKGFQLLPTPESVARQYYVAEPAERIDGTLFDWDWNTANSAGNWQRAAAIGTAALSGAAVQENNWQLMPDPLPAMQMELKPAGKVVRSSGVESLGGFPDKSLSVPAHSRASVLLDSTHLTTAYPELARPCG